MGTWRNLSCTHFQGNGLAGAHLSENSSTTGVIIRHGPHQDAQKSMQTCTRAQPSVHSGVGHTVDSLASVTCVSKKTTYTAACSTRLLNDRIQILLSRGMPDVGHRDCGLLLHSELLCSKSLQHRQIKASGSHSNVRLIH